MADEKCARRQNTPPPRVFGFASQESHPGCRAPDGVRSLTRALRSVQNEKGGKLWRPPSRNISGPRRGAARLTSAKSNSRDCFLAVPAEGFDDVLTMPTYPAFVGLFYGPAGITLVSLFSFANALQLAFPLAAGFALVGPFVAVDLYEMSRRRDLGSPPARAASSVSVRSPAPLWISPRARGRTDQVPGPALFDRSWPRRRDDTVSRHRCRPRWNEPVDQ